MIEDFTTSHHVSPCPFCGGSAFTWGNFGDMWEWDFTKPDGTPDTSALCTWKTPGPRINTATGKRDDSDMEKGRWLLTDPKWAVQFENQWYKGIAWDKNGKVDDIQQTLRKSTGPEHMIGHFVIKPGGTVPGPQTLDQRDDAPSDQTPSGAYA